MAGVGAQNADHIQITDNPSHLVIKKSDQLAYQTLVAKWWENTYQRDIRLSESKPLTSGATPQNFHYRDQLWNSQSPHKLGTATLKPTINPSNTPISWFVSAEKIGPLTTSYPVGRRDAEQRNKKVIVRTEVRRGHDKDRIRTGRR